MALAIRVPKHGGMCTVCSLVEGARNTLEIRGLRVSVVTDFTEDACCYMKNRIPSQVVDGG
jgi:hypothetical protein